MWVDKLASIMELKPCADELGDELLFYFQYEDDAINIQGNMKCGAGFNKDGWWNVSTKNVRYRFHDEISDMLCEVNSYPYNEIKYGIMSNFLLSVCHRIIDYGGISLHAALIERDGKGVIVAGSGNTGKSTCCTRIPAPWNPLCDDETLVLLDKENRYKAHPFPTWSEYTMKRSEKTWNVQYSVPISAIFLLEQSETDGVVPVGKGQAAIYINQAASQTTGYFWEIMDKDHQREARNTAFKNACDLAEAIPFFRLRASLHGKFWEEMEKVIDEL